LTPSCQRDPSFSLPNLVLPISLHWVGIEVREGGKGPWRSIREWKLTSQLAVATLENALEVIRIIPSTHNIYRYFHSKVCQPLEKNETRD
jgi:hypothetical protein